MKLRIVTDENPKNSIEDNTYVMPTSWLQKNTCHLYIASNTWESLDIELSDKTPLGVLRYIRTKIQGEIHCKIEGEDTRNILNLLIELYPSKAGQLRKQFMLKRPLSEVI